LYVCCLANFSPPSIGLVLAADKRPLTREEILSSQNPVPEFYQLTIRDTVNAETYSFKDNSHLFEFRFNAPITIDRDWKIITESTVNALLLPDSISGQNGSTNFGDIELVAYLQPRQARRLVWRFGPAIRMPTATSDSAGSGKWSIGPAFSAVAIGERLVYGVVGNFLWSVAGDPDKPDYNRMKFSPFANYNLEDGWYLVTAASIGADWEASNDERWTIPIGGGVGRVFRLGEQTVNAHMQAFHLVRKPEFGPDWSIRLQVQLPFF